MASISNPTYLNDQDKDKEEGLQKPGAPQTISSGQSASSGASQGIQAQPASSGRFTNIQSYLGANKGAGQQIGNAVGAGVNADIGKSQATADKQTEAFRNAVDASKNTATNAQNLVNQSQQSITPAAAPVQPLNADGSAQFGSGQPAAPAAPAFNATNLVNDPNLLNQYTGIRTGATQAADQANLVNRGDQAVNAAQNLTNTFDKRLGQVNSNDNRFGLLKEFIANPKTNYSSGLSSLDNAFLQKDPNKTLQNLQQNLNSQQKAVVPAMAKDIQNTQGQGQLALQSSKDLGTKLQDQSTKNEAAYYDYLNGQMGDKNAGRAGEQAWLNSQYELLKQGNEIDPKFAQMLGLQQDQRIGNVATGNSFSSLVNQGPATYTNPDQYADDQQRSYYNALAQLAGTSAPRIGTTNAGLAPIATAKDNTAGLFSGANQQLSDLMSQGQQTLGNRTYTNQQISDLMSQYGLQNYKTPEALAGFFTAQNYGSISPLINQLTGASMDHYAGNSFDPTYQTQQAAYNTLSNYLNTLNNAGYYNTVKIRSNT